MACTCIGLELATGAPRAANGVAKLESGLLRCTPLSERTALFRRKAGACQARGPFLTIVEG